MNINGYINKYKNKTFHEMPFNDIDALILSQLSYVALESLVPDVSSKNSRGFKIKNLDPKTYQTLLLITPTKVNDTYLMNALRASKRFGNISIKYASCVFDDKIPTQFTAFTFILDKEEAFIAYRGTDITIAGWKEDFLLTYQNEIPSHIKALDYLNKVVDLIPHQLYLGGHSKGGNLAFYAGLNFAGDNSRIKRLLSFDGPGFRNGIEEFSNYPFAIDKMVKYVTRDDMIGIIFNNINNPYVVRSTSFLLGGHAAYGWQINGKKNSFSLAKSRSKLSITFGNIFNKWLYSISNEDKYLASQFIFDLFSSIHTVNDILTKALGDILRYNKKIKKYTVDERKRLKKLISTLQKTIKEELSLDKKEKKDEA